MSQCPVCSTPIENSFGLVECPGCHKILFADFNGELAVHNEEEVAADVVEEPEAAFDQSWDLGAEAELDSEAAPESDSEPESDAEPFVIDDPIVEPDIPVDAVSFDEVVEPESVESEGTPTGVIAEINEFANSADSSLKDGQWLYTLTIDNIDTEDLREEVIESLRDPKLAIPHELLNFELPTLILKDLNAVKTSVIVSRVKHLPVDVSWEQRSLIQGDEVHNG